jgi:hypothetical protein
MRLLSPRDAVHSLWAKDLDVLESSHVR